MLTPVLEKLLVLQDRDRRRRETERELKAVPHELGLVEGRIATEKAAIENARQEMKELEAKKKVIDTEIGSAEQRVSKYRTQQLEVRKNDEYRALGHEIETTQAQIGQFEEQEIAILYSIDEAKKKFQAAELVLKENISSHEQRIRVLKEREKNLLAELQETLNSVATARQPLSELTLRTYDRIAQRNFPVCVSVQGGKCGGCHLKVSSEVESDVRGKGDKLITCDQCGRIVWWEA
jgi:predicted  nucleic acid-binding Zn-ribbon protein